MPHNVRMIELLGDGHFANKPPLHLRRSRGISLQEFDDGPLTRFPMAGGEHIADRPRGQKLSQFIFADKLRLHDRCSGRWESKRIVAMMGDVGEVPITIARAARPPGGGPAMVYNLVVGRSICYTLSQRRDANRFAALLIVGTP
jgi:hypothetical protein